MDFSGQGKFFFILLDGFFYVFRMKIDWWCLNIRVSLHCVTPAGEISGATNLAFTVSANRMALFLSLGGCNLFFRDHSPSGGAWPAFSYLCARKLINEFTKNPAGGNLARIQIWFVQCLELIDCVICPRGA